MKKKTKPEKWQRADDAASIELQDRMRAAWADVETEIAKLPPTRRAVMVRVFDKAKRRVEDALRYEYQTKWSARHERSAVASEYMGKAVVAEGTLKGRHIRDVKHGSTGGRKWTAHLKATGKLIDFEKYRDAFFDLLQRRKPRAAADRLRIKYGLQKSVLDTMPRYFRKHPIPPQ